MGKGVIELTPRKVYDSIRNPQLRFTYDNMLKVNNNNNNNNIAYVTGTPPSEVWQLNRPRGGLEQVAKAHCTYNRARLGPLYIQCSSR